MLIVTDDVLSDHDRLRDRLPIDDVADRADKEGDLDWATVILLKNLGQAVDALLSKLLGYLVSAVLDEFPEDRQPVLLIISVPLSLVPKVLLDVVHN